LYENCSYAFPNSAFSFQYAISVNTVYFVLHEELKGLQLKVFDIICIVSVGHEEYENKGMVEEMSRKNKGWWGELFC
jgi:hypothetical protein